MDQELTEQAAAKPDGVQKVELAFAGGKKNWGWSLWHAEVNLDDLHRLTGGETRGQLVAVAKASAYLS